MPQEISMLWVLLSRKQGFVQFFTYLIEFLLIKGSASPITDHYLIILRKLSIEGKDDIRIHGPFILFNQLQLAILPFNKTRIVLSLCIPVLIYLYQMLHFIHEATGIVTLRNVHGESKHLHVVL